MTLIGVLADASRKDVIDFKNCVIVDYGALDLSTNPDDASLVDVILVLGGDGFFLHSVHAFLHLCKPFYGINYGTVGFLLNAKIGAQNLLTKIQNANETKLYLLKAEIETSKGTFIELAMNEVTLFRSSGQVAKIRVFVDDVLRIQELMSDGILLSTASGSTAYNFSLHGSIFSPDAKVLSLCPISPFRPRHFRSALLLDTAKVRFEVMERAKRPVLATADFKHFEDVISLSAYLSQTDFVRVLFNKEKPFNEKIISEQFLI
jgi:NAD+ kinase